VGHLLEVRNLKTHFTTDRGIVKAVDGVSYYIDEHEIVGLVGESGCGKSVTQLSVTQLISSPPGKIVDGVALFEGQDLLNQVLCPQCPTEHDPERPGEVDRKLTARRPPARRPAS